MVPRTALVALLLITAGCLGAPSPASDAETPPSDPETTMTQTPTPTGAPPETASSAPGTTVYATDCPPRLHVEAAAESQRERAGDADVLAYGNLSAERRAEFGRALESGDSELDSVPETWSRPRIVAYRGESYATVVSIC